jgi:hypothetical protein
LENEWREKESMKRKEKDKNNLKTRSGRNQKVEKNNALHMIIFSYPLQLCYRE